MTDAAAANPPEIAANPAAEPDMVPAVINDLAAPVAHEAAPVAETPAAEPAEESLAVAKPPSNTDRDSIAERFRAKRKEHDATFMNKGETPPFVAAIDQHNAALAAEGADPAQEAPAQVAEPARIAAPATHADTFNVKVRGQTYSATRDQLVQMAGLTPEEADGLPATTLVRAAQTMEASRSYLDEAKTQLQGARSAAHAPAATPAVNQQPTAVPASPQPPQGHTDHLREAIEKVQYGEPDEARAAFDQALDAKFAEHTTRARAETLRQEGDRAIAEFGQQNADIAAHPQASDFLLSQSVREICNDFIALGAAPEAVAPLLSNPTLAYDRYHEARLKGLRVRAPAELLAAAGHTVRSVFAPQQAAPAQAAPILVPAPVRDRIAEKRALPTQPTRSVASPAQAAAPAPKSRSQAVAEMRRARGQSV